MSDIKDFDDSENATTPGGRTDAGETSSLFRSFFL